MKNFLFGKVEYLFSHDTVGDARPEYGRVRGVVEGDH